MKTSLIFHAVGMKTALITIFLHTHNDFGSATISGLIQTADSIPLFMLSPFHVT